MRIYQLEIKHFRGIESAKITLEKPLICFIGACDTTKTTILDAIGYVLLPNWFIPLDDSDFTGCDTSKTISIEATIGPVPEELKADNKYGLCLQGWDDEAHDIVDEPEDASYTRVITIKLSIDSTLTPEWSVVTKRNPDGPHISYKDRKKLGVSLIGADIENELSWTRGSSLARLTTDNSYVNYEYDAMSRLTKVKYNGTPTIYNADGDIQTASDGWLPETVTGNRFMFTGREYSEGGLYYYRARYYNPSIGRFVQTDPVEYRRELNLYTYTRNNPINLTDSFGLWPWGPYPWKGDWDLKTCEAYCYSRAGIAPLPDGGGSCMRSGQLNTCILNCNARDNDNDTGYPPPDNDKNWDPWPGVGADKRVSFVCIFIILLVCKAAAIIVKRLGATQ